MTTVAERPEPPAISTIPASRPIAAAAKRIRPQTIAAHRALSPPHQRCTTSLRQTAGGRPADEDRVASDKESETGSAPLCPPRFGSQQISFCFPDNPFQPCHLCC